MHITRTKVPGNGVVVHHMTTRHGERLRLMVGDGGNRHLFTFDTAEFDAPAWEIVLEPDEAEKLAEVLRQQADDVIGERGR